MEDIDLGEEDMLGWLVQLSIDLAGEAIAQEPTD